VERGIAAQSARDCAAGAHDATTTRAEERSAVAYGLCPAQPNEHAMNARSYAHAHAAHAGRA
jgi:hypothetical protein